MTSVGETVEHAKAEAEQRVEVTSTARRWSGCTARRAARRHGVKRARVAN